MLKHRNINKICWVVLALTLVIGTLFTAAASSGRLAANTGLGYEGRLFDTSRVHTIDIVMDDWEGFLETAMTEVYSSCTILIDGEKYANVGIRAKGNTSLMQVSAYGNDRYSFKVEFDKYSAGNSYYGLDKLSLNNIIYDNTYMKDYLSFQMMNHVGVASSLCSFVYITVNGEDWGLYLALEGVEEGFLQRNYGKEYGELYKPDSMGFGGGRGNGAGFNMEDFANNAANDGDAAANNERPSPPEGFDPSAMFGGEGNAPPEGFSSPAMAEEGGENGRGGGMGGMGSSDVRLQYVDDDPDSYANIFNNAKTDISSADQARLIASLKQLSEGTGIEEVVDVNAVIKYLVAHHFVCNADSYTGTMVHNYYLYEEDGVLSMIPWDYNLAFGGMGMGMGGRGQNGASNADGATSEVNAPIDTPVSGGSLQDRPMVAWIFESEEYTALYHQYYAEFIETYFNSGYFERMMEETIALIAPYIEKDPTAFCTYEEFLTGVETLQEFCLLRAQSITGQLDGTIPSTQEGQSADRSALIDASHLSISDMGAMGGGNRPGQAALAGDERPAAADGGAQSAASAESDSGIAAPGANGMQERPERGDVGEFGRPGNFDPSMMNGGSAGAAASSTTQWLLLGGSILLLAIGLLIAKKYKSHF